MFIFSASDFDFMFTTGRTSDFVITRDLPKDLNAFTLSVWVRTTDRTSNERTILSYATSTSDNSLLIMNTGSQLGLHINGESKLTGLPTVRDGKWHNIVITWRSSDGFWQEYFDGKRVKQSSGFKRGSVISKSGAFVLGQDQDEVGGDFEGHQAWIGLISKLNMWDYVLSAQQIANLYKEPGLLGNTLKWDYSWIAGVRGKTRILRPSSCCE